MYHPRAIVELDRSRQRLFFSLFLLVFRYRADFLERSREERERERKRWILPSFLKKRRGPRKQRDLFLLAFGHRQKQKCILIHGGGRCLPREDILLFSRSLSPAGTHQSADILISLSLSLFISLYFTSFDSRSFSLSFLPQRSSTSSPPPPLEENLEREELEEDERRIPLLLPSTRN